MPTVHREEGFRFRIYVDDHEPPHVHVWKAGLTAKIRIGNFGSPPGAVQPTTMRVVDVYRAVRVVEANQQYFLAAWRQIHGHA